MEVERIFSAEQIQVPQDLAQVIREYSKSVIKENPNDILEFSWKYFKQKVEKKEELKLQQLQREADERMKEDDDM